MDIRGKHILAVLGAVPFETDPLVRLFDGAGSFRAWGQSFAAATYGGLSIIIGSTGLGKVNAAVTTAALLERYPVRQVWNVGCAGAFEEGPLKVGDVLVSSTSMCGDEGVLTKNSILPSNHIGIPIVTYDGIDYFDDLPLSVFSVFRTIREQTPDGRYRLVNHTRSSAAHAVVPAEAVAPASDGHGVFRLMYGPSLTVGMVSGDAEVALRRFSRYAAYAENMEGSAVAQACFRSNVSMVECRGISNVAGNRLKSEWRMDKAIAHCHGIILNWLQDPTALGMGLGDGDT
jgi:futalosine hydrolase